MFVLRRSSLSVLLIVVLSFANFVPTQQQQQTSDDGDDERAKVPAVILASALNFAAQRNEEDVVEKLLANDVDSLYGTAKIMYDDPDGNKENRGNAVRIFHALADGGEPHVPSMVRLGQLYSDGNDNETEENKDRALEYFVRAGEKGPHHASLYNAGRIFAEKEEYAPALAYMRAAASLPTTRPDRASPQITKVAEEGYDILSRRLTEAANELSLQDLVDLFPYANPNDFPTEGGEAGGLWNSAMVDLQSFFRKDTVGNVSVLESAVQRLTDFFISYEKDMSELQTVSLRRILALALESMNDEL